MVLHNAPDFYQFGACFGILPCAFPAMTLDNRPSLSKDGLVVEKDFYPPAASKPWVYWWWLDGASSKEGITKYLEEMKKEGISGVFLFDAREGGPLTPKGNRFMGDPWRENFRHAVRECVLLQIEMGVDLCSRCNAGGPLVSREHAIKAIEQMIPKKRHENRRWMVILSNPTNVAVTWSRREAQ
jgi:alpha-L-rhamnosidase